MGKIFGNLATVRGVVYYTLSHHEQKPFAGVLSSGPPNLVRRFLHRWWTYLPTFIVTYFFYTGIEAAYHHSKRKDPRLYVNEINPNPPTECEKLKMEKEKKKKKKSG